MTLPITPAQAVLGKFLAGWIFLAIALVLTMPIWYSVNLLGDPDNGVIAASYAASLLMAGVYLAIGATISAMTRNQVIAFVVSAAICFLFVLSGTQVVLGVFQDWVPDIITSAISTLSVLTHFEDVTRGVFDFRDIVFYVSMIAFWLFANTLAVHLKKAD
jgi:ABC-2 type transport system permease protein